MLRVAPGPIAPRDRCPPSQSGDVFSAVESIAAVSEENSASAEQVSAATEEMHAQASELATSAASLATMAERLDELLGGFRLDVELEEPAVAPPASKPRRLRAA